MKMSQYVVIARSQRCAHHLLAVDSSPSRGGFPKHLQTLVADSELSAQH